jgi:hypothetical protein
MNELVNARIIKALLIDNLINFLKNDYIIGSEIMFGRRKGIVDLLMLSDKFTYAYEIKARNDDFRKIKMQMEEYNKTFDFVYLVTTENHFERARNQVPQKNGIIIIYNDSSIKILREARINKKLIKEELLSTMTIKFIRKNFEINKNISLAYDIRENLKKVDLDFTRNCMYNFLYERIKPRFSNFLLERGIITHYEEVALLSFKNKKIKV